SAAVADAVRNARENGIENCTFLPGEVRHVLPTLMRDGIRAEVVVADPPRAGFHPKALQALATLGPARLVYVSCNPSTLARDVGDLVRQGYRLAGAEHVATLRQTPPRAPDPARVKSGHRADAGDVRALGSRPAGGALPGDPRRHRLGRAAQHRDRLRLDGRRPARAVDADLLAGDHADPRVLGAVQPLA